MLFLILFVVIALVAWALQLMERAIKCQEFSLMLAGCLVAAAAAATMTVYFLMGHYMLYMAQAGQDELEAQIDLVDWEKALLEAQTEFETAQAPAIELP